MSFNSAELQMIYAAIDFVRQNISENLADSPPAEEHNALMANYKLVNSILRKLKRLMEENGVSPMEV